MKRPASAGPSSSDRAEPPTSCSSAGRSFTSLRSFFSSGASSSSGSASRPANVSARSSSAEQTATPSHLKISSMRDVQRWLAEESIASCSSADLQRIREAVAVLTSGKKEQPSKEDVRPLLGPKNWDVAQRKDKKPRPLGDMVQEFQGKVIKAAQKLQQQLPDSAEQPASSTAEQSVPMEEAFRLQSASGSALQPASSAVEQAARMDTTDVIDFDDDPMLTRLKAKQRKRAQDSAAEDQRPLAKPKATQGRKKRTAATASDSAEQPVSKRKDRLLTPQLFALGARDPSDPSDASLDSAVRTAAVRQQSQIMHRVFEELRELSSCAWVVGDADVRCKAIMRDAFDLQTIPATQRILKKRSISGLYTGVCGALQPIRGGVRQDYTHVSLTASWRVERQARRFVQAIDEIEEFTMEKYPCLWELKNRQHDPALNGLPEMPSSPHELFEMLNDTEASPRIPFGRLPSDGQIGPPFLKAVLPLMEVFYQHIVCLGGLC